MKTKLLFLFFLFGCQQKGTAIFEESANIFGSRVVLMDTRTALDYSSFHIKGSASLLVEDFIILQNPLAKPKDQNRQFDANLGNTIERLAAKGIHPHLKVLLLGYKKDSIANLKWRWLLNSLDITDVELAFFAQVRKNKNGRFAQAESQPVWSLNTSAEVQREFILDKVRTCFVKSYIKEKWPEEYCQGN